MNISDEQALKYYKHELETKVNTLKKEISDLKILIRRFRGKKLGYDSETNRLIDYIFSIESKKKELSKILYIIGD
jgi:hypothetical protein